MTKSEQFFYDNAGWNYDPKTETSKQGKLRCAVELAKAEAWFEDSGLEYAVLPDEDADLSWMDEAERNESHEVVGVVLQTPDGEHVQSLWGIVDATPEYLRVIVAELASEEMHNAARCAEVSAI